MSKKRKKIILALVLSILVILIMPKILGEKANKTPKEIVQTISEQSKSNVLILVQDVPPRTKITPEMFELVKKPSEYIHPMAIINPENVIDKITLVALNAGEEILRTKIADADTDLLSYKLKEGMVGYTVGISDLNAASGMLAVGDKVKIQGLFTKEIAGDDIVEYALEGINIIAIGHDLGGGKIAANYENGYSTMTLEVTPDEAQRLRWLEQFGTLKYLPESVSTGETEKVAIVNANTFFDGQDQFETKEYIDKISELTNIRNAETSLLKAGTAEDLIRLRKDLEYNKLYYDEYNPDDYIIDETGNLVPVYETVNDKQDDSVENNK